MKKNYKIKLVAIAMLIVGSIGNVNAINLKPAVTTVISNNTDNWVEIKNENGIVVSYKQGKLGKSNVLYFSFLNENKKSISFNWSLNDKNGKAITDPRNVVIEAGQSLKPMSGDIKNIVFLTDDQNPNSISININF
tara:strand:+ start:1143 stop:1550 length:408 start_codon:yes stop_codon:yes gene_type:complete